MQLFVKTVTVIKWIAKIRKPLLTKDDIELIRPLRFGKHVLIQVPLPRGYKCINDNWHVFSLSKGILNIKGLQSTH